MRRAPEYARHTRTEAELSLLDIGQAAVLVPCHAKHVHIQTL